MDGSLYLALSVVILIFSIIVHEVMHGYVALRFGDHTAERAGRLTFNPVPHIDPIGSVLLPLIFLITNSGLFLAWAKPVPVNPLNFTNLRAGELWVSAAGILSNLGLALISTVIFHVLEPSLGFAHPVTQVMLFATRINLVLAVFNLVPIPPLDGSKILISQLPFNLARDYERIMGPYGMFILLGLLWFTNIFSFIIGAVVRVYGTLFQMPL